MSVKIISSPREDLKDLKVDEDKVAKNVERRISNTSILYSLILILRLKLFLIVITTKINFINCLF